MPDHTPLYEMHTRTGAVLMEEAGWLMPAHFGDAAGEYAQARERVALFDLSHHGKVELTGADALRFLHNLCTNDILKLGPGQGCEAFLTTGQAKIIAHALVYCCTRAGDGPTLWLDVGPGLGPKALMHLDHYLVSEQAELADRTREFVQLHLAGPQAKATLKNAMANSIADLGELEHVSREFGSSLCQIRRHNRLALPGFDIVCPSADADSVWQTLHAAGARPAGMEAYHILRVEAGTPVNGLDIDETNLPQEVGRTDRTVSFTKGCYIGQETIARIYTYGHVNRALVGLKLAGSGPVPKGSKLYRAGQEVGHITSSVVSPHLGAMALAYVRRGHQEAATVLEVEDAGSRRNAEVVGLPCRAG